MRNAIEWNHLKCVECGSKTLCLVILLVVRTHSWPRWPNFLRSINLFEMGLLVLRDCNLWENYMKIPCAFTPLNGWLFNYPSWIFYMLQYNNRTFRWWNFYHKFRCTRTRVLPVKFPHFQEFAKVLIIGIFGLSKRHEKIHQLAIFLYR